MHTKKKRTTKSPIIPKTFAAVRGIVIKSSTTVPQSEFSDQFVQGMYDRMAVSYFKYGKVSDGYPKPLSALASLGQRLVKYQETGNTEYLIDAANFAMIEFMRPSVVGAHFTPTDAHGSPGRTKQSGTITTKHNLDLQ